MDERGQYRDGTQTVTGHEEYFETKYYLVGSASGKILQTNFIQLPDTLVGITINLFVQGVRSRFKAGNTSSRFSVFYQRTYPAVSRLISDTFDTRSKWPWIVHGNSIRKWRVHSLWCRLSTSIRSQGLRYDLSAIFIASLINFRVLVIWNFEIYHFFHLECFNSKSLKS